MLLLREDADEKKEERVWMAQGGFYTPMQGKNCLCAIKLLGSEKKQETRNRQGWTVRQESDINRIRKKGRHRTNGEQAKWTQQQQQQRRSKE